MSRLPRGTMLVKKPRADEQAGRAGDLPPSIARRLMAQWQEIAESLPERRCAPQTVAKLVEIPGEVIEGLRANIEAERDQPTRAKIAKEVEAVRASRLFDDTDPNMLALFEPKFSDREGRTEERTRKLAVKALDDLREGKGNKPFHPRPEGINSATQCALIVSIKLNWPGVTNRQAQAMCEALYAAAGGDITRPGSTPNRSATDGAWRDHLREARRLGPKHVYSRVIASHL
jgi:hypothetical protein